ncbi:hypothetical protein PMG71_15320 [Roseofilum sp. BLCC_M154]|uniref:Uncharacterized protein n=1 Tax=Roseofilum acuticapitatum BLCC-M154 TaxID=3022444 RepID=A0ABT7AV56_9CYAN|nr:hypothetical protein [Roseofilum acuticapitatum]MDJ1170802.1 hypothetical protein [Roseofilum acuticapitatum BLCC-M154]
MYLTGIFLTQNPKVLTTTWFWNTLISMVKGWILFCQYSWLISPLKCLLAS